MMRAWYERCPSIESLPPPPPIQPSGQFRKWLDCTLCTLTGSLFYQKPIKLSEFTLVICNSCGLMENLIHLTLFVSLSLASPVVTCGKNVWGQWFQNSGAYFNSLYLVISYSGLEICWETLQWHWTLGTGLPQTWPIPGLLFEECCQRSWWESLRLVLSNCCDKQE